MVELKSKQSARDSLRLSLRGNPALFWADFDGKLMAEILDELDDNTREYSNSKLELSRNRTKKNLMHPDRGPTRGRFLATWLSQGRDYIDNWVRGILRKRSLGGIALWHARQSSPPTRKESDAAWEAWIDNIAATLWPTHQELEQVLSPAHLAFRELILTIEIVKVASNCIRWRIPSTDVHSEGEVAQNALALTNLFEQREEMLGTANNSGVVAGQGPATTPAPSELLKSATSPIIMGEEDRFSAQNEPKTGHQELRGAVAQTRQERAATSDPPVHGLQVPVQRQFFRSASLAPLSATVPQQTPLSSERTQILSASEALHPGANVLQPVPESTKPQFFLEVSMSAPGPARGTTTPSRPGPFKVEISDFARSFCPPEILGEVQKIIHDLALQLDNLNKLADNAKRLLDTTVAERHELINQERKILCTKFSLTFHGDLPQGSGTQEAIKEIEMQNDSLCIQLRQKLTECNERAKLLENERKRTESMKEQVVKVYVEFVNEHLREGILKPLGH